ncbi:hypothetical protein PFNF54_01633 [Plasmodium falciparum NF54]|uniref:Rifin n=1 Tax=Plasmodium falciparum (isolate NF54) TaxID=5843 RepID=W7KJ65_PLAFO|nr:hypothetical protein PFNF54_01633 [Plasmodium falciparum NF54]
MKTTRQKCKDKCDKEIQKIILKDKIDKELTEKFATLQTDIQNDAIPTCVCEKSLADKVEKTCLKCGGVLGGGVTPAWGFLSGIVYTGWKAAALAAAKKLAAEAGAAEGASQGAAAGATRLIELIQSTFQVQNIAGQSLESIFTAQTYTDVSNITKALFNEYAEICLPIFTDSVPVRGVRYNISSPICTFVEEGILATSRDKGGSPITFIEKKVETMVSKAEGVATARAADVAAAKTAEFEATKVGAVEATYAGYHTTIIASIIAILIIVLIMVIIYLILRYRRKKKMKKKLQYIKLLEE